MACVPELFSSLRQGFRWRRGDDQRCEGGPQHTCQSREEVPAPRTKGGGWRLQPRSHEGNENFTTQRAIPCHIFYELPVMLIPLMHPCLMRGSRVLLRSEERRVGKE